MSQKQEVLLRYFREGQSKKGIARDLGLSPKGVRYHYGVIKEELETFFQKKFNTTREAVAFMQTNGMLD